MIDRKELLKLRHYSRMSRLQLFFVQTVLFLFKLFVFIIVMSVIITLFLVMFVLWKYIRGL